MFRSEFCEVGIASLFSYKINVRIKQVKWDELVLKYKSSGDEPN